MAFTGTPTVTKIGDGLARITGVSLAFGAQGIIGLFGSGAAVELPEGCIWRDYEDVSLIEAVQVQINPVGDVSNFAIPIRVVKTGVKPENFQIALTNDAAATNSAELEIYVRFH